jgi:arylsulfatase A-like enzyme
MSEPTQPARAADPGRVENAARVLLAVVWAALFTGVLHAVQVPIALARGHITFTSRDVVWMAPLAYLVIFIVPGIVGAAAAFLAPRLVRPPLAVFGAAAFGVFCLMLPHTQISRTASAILAAGVGVQLARMASANPERWWRRLRMQTIALAGLVVVAAVAMRGWLALRERGRIAALPEASAGSPNVLIIILDTVRAANLSLYGYARATTPEIEKRAAEGVTFDHAFATAPWTLPSHAGIFTGHYPTEFRASWTESFDDRFPPLAERLGARGYLTAGFIANHNYTSYDSGLDRGFQHYQDYLVDGEQIMRSSSFAQTTIYQQVKRSRTPGQAWKAIRASDWGIPRTLGSSPKHGEEVSREFVSWLDAARARRPGRPFFAFLNYMDAHQPTYAPPPFDAKFSGGLKGVVRYDAAIAYLDHQVGLVLDSLERRGLLDSTIVVIASDHGELWGEHEIFGHAHNVYLPVLEVPLVMRYPARLPAGARVARPISLRDVSATIAELAGLGGGASSFPGASLVALAHGDSAAPSSPVFSQVAQNRTVEPRLPTFHGPLRSLIDDQHHYIRNGEGVEQLFAWRSDSAEARDLVKTDDGRAMLPRYRTLTSGTVPPSAGPAAVTARR